MYNFFLKFYVKMLKFYFRTWLSRGYFKILVLKYFLMVFFICIWNFEYFCDNNNFN